MPSDLTIVIPTYKEAANIPELVKRIRAVCDGTILFVDDSPDMETVNAAESLGCKVLHRTTKRGLSSAIIDGIDLATTRKVIVMDADLQHPPELLPKMAEALDKNGLVVASRWVPGGGVKDWSFKRVLVSKFANVLALPLASKIKDRTSGFFGLNKNIVDTSKLSPIGWKTGLEIMVKGKYESAVEVPFIFVPRTKGESKFNFKQVRDYIKQLFFLYMGKYRIVNFMLVGGVGYVINIGIYSALTLIPVLRAQTNIFGKQYYLPPFAISTLIAIACNYYLNKRFTFQDRKEVKAGFWQYMAMGIITGIVDMALLFL
ncbi:MAG TPA: glycosyltransferase family 2 protein, partial [Dehalococcoidales bacterium]|nr:glycosyltransferase family 2 protein [Dehalococcoidales bacterium]